MKTLGWMAFQAAIVAGFVYIQNDVGHQLGKEPNYGAALLVGIALAFGLTWIIVMVRDSIVRARSSRRAAADVTGATLKISPVGRIDCEMGGDGERLIAPSRGGGDSPKLLGGRRIG